MPSKQMSMNEMDREIEVLKDRYRELIKSSDQARITENTTSGITVLVLEPAGPATPMNARDYVRLALAPAFSLVVGIGLAFFVDGLDTRVRTASDAETVLELPVLASLTDRRRREHLIAPSEETASR
jgi:capsular polysaccharide biosynthesis protein